MKKSILVLTAVLLVITVTSSAQEEKKTAETKTQEQKQAVKSREIKPPSIGSRSSRKPTAPVDRAARLIMQMEVEYKKKTAETEKFVQELDNILKLAEEEKAVKTAQAVKTMIELRKKELEKMKEQFEARKLKINKLMKEGNNPARSRTVRPPVERTLPSRRPAPVKGAQGLEKK